LRGQRLKQSAERRLLRGFAPRSDMPGPQTCRLDEIRVLGGTTKHLHPHRPSELSGIRVLPAWMIAGNHDRAFGWPKRGAVPEGTRFRRESAQSQKALVCHFSEGQYGAHVREVGDFAVEERSAPRNFFSRWTVLGRNALHGVGDVHAAESKAVALRNSERLGSQPKLVERVVEPLPARVAREGSSGPVGA
jgi:hypothetical protein